MKRDSKRGFPMPMRIIISAILVFVQLAFIFGVLYDFTLASAWSYAVSMIFGIITVVIIINRRGNPDHKITWIIFILLFPIFGITVFLLWGGGRVMPHIRKRMTSCEQRYLQQLDRNDEVIDRLRYYDLHHSRQAEYLSGESGFPVYENTSTEYFSPGENLMPRLLSELKSAKKYIFIEFFIIAEGKMWDSIHEILKEKSRKGVEVKIIFDDFGSMKRQRKGFISMLRSENIQVSAFNPINPVMSVFMNNRNHRKIIVIDGETAVTGGVNIGDEYINEYVRFGHWLDSAIIIKGDAVKSFTAMFCAMWEFTAKQRLPYRKYVAEQSIKTEGFVLPYADDPLNGKNPAEGIYMQILNTAQKYVYIATPYLVIDNAMKTVLMMAAKSGVDVRIVTPHIPDKWYVHHVTQYNYLELLEAGVKIYEYTPGFIHSKMFVSDDRIATIGSINMDYRSFIFHFECGAWICNSDTVTDIKVDMMKTIEKSQQIDLYKWKKRPVHIRLLQAILHIFAPFM